MRRGAKGVTYAIVGCGYTGSRVAARLIERGDRVIATSRHPEHLNLPGATRVRLDADEPDTFEKLRDMLEHGVRVLYSLPVRISLIGAPIARVLYLSTTGVYGVSATVDETTQPAPRTPREQARLDQERELASGPWETLILRPAAIYGPSRGVHVSMQEGRHKLWGDGSNYVSRIHVEDLAAHCIAGLDSRITGAYPVADSEPCPAIEIAQFCATLLGLPSPQGSGELPPEDTRRVNRRVDGAFIRKELGIDLRYPSYRTGIPESLNLKT